MDDVRKMLRNLSDAAKERGAPLDWFEDLYEVAEKIAILSHGQRVNLIHSSSIGWATIQNKTLAMLWSLDVD